MSLVGLGLAGMVGVGGRGRDGVFVVGRGGEIWIWRRFGRIDGRIVCERRPSGAYQCV